MNKLAIPLFLLMGLFSACSGNKKSEHTEQVDESAQTKFPLNYYGEKITEEGAIHAESLTTALGEDDSMNVKVKGKIVSTCKKKGCWMKIDIGDGKTMRVTFKDYGFFVPKGVSDKETVFEGKVKKTMTDVETLKHYAEDEGKSQGEIEAIKQPLIDLTFEAVGVIIKDKTNP